MRRKTAKIIGFFLVLALSLGCFHRVFQFKNTSGNYLVTAFYREPKNSVDVMCFGSSHAFANISTAVLWEDYGIACYELCGASQPIWNTYYYVKEALKTQTPKVLVVDVHGITKYVDYLEHSRIIQNTYGLRPSWDKVENVMASAPKSSWPDYLLEYPTYHSRYTELGRSDFDPSALVGEYYNDWKGFELLTGVYPMEKPREAINTDREVELTEKTEKYLRAILELADERGIPLLLISAPYNLLLREQGYYNAAARITQEYDGAVFLNFNSYPMYDELGLDFQTDFADSIHLNQIGTKKYTGYLGKYLKEHYDIPDRRGDSSYASYDAMAENCAHRIANYELQQEKDLDGYLEKLQEGDYLAVYRITGGSRETANFGEVSEELKACGFSVDETAGTGVCVAENGERLFQADDSVAFTWHRQTDESSVLTVSAVQDGGISVNLNRTDYAASGEGLYILVYDLRENKLLDSAYFAAADGLITDEKTAA